MANSIFSDADLALLANLIDQTLPDQVTVLRRSVVADGMGGQTATWAPHGPPVAARLHPTALAAEGLIADVITETQGWQVTLPLGTDVTERDRLTQIITQGGVPSTRTLEVITVQSPRSFAVSVRLICVEMK